MLNVKMILTMILNPNNTVFINISKILIVLKYL